MQNFTIFANAYIYAAINLDADLIQGFSIDFLVLEELSRSLNINTFL